MSEEKDSRDASSSNRIYRCRYEEKERIATNNSELIAMRGIDLMKLCSIS